MEAQGSQQRRIALSLALAAAAVVGYAAWRSRRSRGKASSRSIRLRILYGTTAGTSQRWAQQLSKSLLQSDVLAKSSIEVSIEDLASFAFDTLLQSAAGTDEVVALLLSTHTDGVPPPSCDAFCTLLADHVHDFRVGGAALKHLNFAVLGFGSSEYAPAGHFCSAAVRADAALAALGATRLVPLAKVTDTKEAEIQVAPWRKAFRTALSTLAAGAAPQVATGPQGRAAVALVGGGEQEDSDSDDSDGSEAAPAAGGSDVEELAESCAGQVGTKVPEMLTTKHRAQLTKEGYKIVGSHSAVKLCRWTKHQLRGRGGCYKHSFYGITSHQCMEATPSLACANKCVFCWRHHKNPVGTEWKWRMDPPDMIVAEGIEQHRKMIRECKGIPGVKKERLAEAMNIRHCALSLVGEPIMYPKINDLVDDLHRRKISTFLVTNAQFPDAIRSLRPITQLYISVDAGTPEALKAVDRPLFADFWPRYIDSMKAIADKKQRTVYRLTLVKDQNMTDPADYAKLIKIGNPDFIEIKSVTFCGESKASDLTISSSPWHEEVKTFSEQILSKEGLESDYEMSCEHQHSCIVLISHKKYKINDVWHTWIDYDKFHELVSAGREFSAMDYMAPTPEWALYGSEEAGFDPKETRVFHNRTKRKAEQGLLSEAQLRNYPRNPADPM